jgi:hypothetical protein
MVVASFSLRSFHTTADIKSATTNSGEVIYPTFFLAGVPMFFIGLAGFASINGLDKSSPYGIENSTILFVNKFCCLSCCCVPYLTRNDRFTGNSSLVITPLTVLPICLHAPE